MKQYIHKVPFVMGAFLLVAGLVPAVALADTGEDANVPVSASVHVNLGDNETEAEGHISATGSARMSDEGRANIENSDTMNIGVTSTESERHSGQSKGNESDNNGNDNNNNDNEVEVDHNSAETASSTIDSPRLVSNRGELRSFLNHLVKDDQRIASVQVSSSTVEAQYAMPSKFLWAIPASITADVKVNSDGSVTVTYPWYAFLFAKHGDVESQVSAAATSSGATTSFSANTQAHLLDLLFANLRTSVSSQ